MATITSLPFDLRGTLPSNLRTGEIRPLTRIPGKINRMTCPEFGAYYTDSLTVRTTDGTLLKRDVDYVTTYYYPDLGELSGKEVCAIIVITNPAIGDEIRISYQAVGGIYSLSVKELATILNHVNDLPGTIKWDDIINKPLQFVPSDHTHEFWQLYGLDSTLENLTLLSQAIAVGNKGILADNKAYYQNYVDIAEEAIVNYSAHVQAHISDTDNPHLTDKVKIGLSQINNWGMANYAEIIDPSVDNKYLPIGGIYYQLIQVATPILTAHIQNKNNPHDVKLTDPLLDLWSTAEIDALFDLRLRRDQVAADSAALGQQSIGALTQRVQSNLAASNVATNSKFTMAQIAPVPVGNLTDLTLVGTNSYRTFQELFASIGMTPTSNIYFVGSNGNLSIAGALAKIQTYSWVPTGTWVIGAYSYLWFAPGRVPVYTPFVVVCRRDPTDPSGFKRYI